MSFWNTDKLKAECQANQLIVPYRAERALRCAYELGVGPEAFITSNEDDTTHLPPNSKVTIPPGQFCLLITHEVVYVPPTAIAFISIRARIKFQGLVNVSGFHVDPGFRGKLKFAVYNAGSKEIILDQDERIFMIWYADLNAATPDPYPAVLPANSIITSEDVSRLKGEVASPAELKKQIDDLEKDVGIKFHTTEQSRLYNRSLLFLLIGIIATTLIKPYFDGAKDPGKPVEAVKTGDNTVPPVRPPDGEKVIVIPAHLGFYILGAGAITGASVIAAAYIARGRSK